ncbi:hypothetical protein LCGC14_2693340, partial [marine sediment metagenome]
SFISYRPYDAQLQVDQGGVPRLAAQFTLSLAKCMSAGAIAPIGGGESFAEAHDDLLLEAFCVRNRPRGGKTSALPDSLRIDSVYRLRVPEKEKLKLLSPPMIVKLKDDVARLTEAVPKYPLSSPMAETEAYVVRLTVDELARCKDDLYRLPATHFRLLTRSHKSYYPVGYLTFAGRWRVETAADPEGKANVGDVIVTRPWKEKVGPKKLLVDWVYRLPADEKPSGIIFRRSEPVNLPKVRDGVPRETDGDDNMIALTVKPRRSPAKFPEEEKSRLLQPTKMEIQPRLDGKFSMRIFKKERVQNPPMFANAQYKGPSIVSGFLAGPETDLRKVPPQDGRNINSLHVPDAQHRLVQVHCEVDGKYPAASVADLLKRMSPKLILSNGLRIAHSGAFLLTGPERAGQVYIYYDPSAGLAGKRLDPNFAALLAANLANVRKI